MQWTSSYSWSESPYVAKSTNAATTSRSDIHDDDTLSASTVIGTGQKVFGIVVTKSEQDLLRNIFYYFSS